MVTMSSFQASPQKSCPLVDLNGNAPLPAVQKPYGGRGSTKSEAVEYSKKSKTKDSSCPIHKVYTFSIDSSPVYVQVLSCHTLWQLVDSMLRECDPRGEDGEETADCHLWNLKLPGSSKLYTNDPYPCGGPKYCAERTQLKDKAAMWNQGSELHLEYDYGTTTKHTLTVCGIQGLDPSVDIYNFPRRQPEESPVGPSSFQTNVIDLNSQYPNLNRWAFETSHPKSTHVNLFQAGRRNVHGFLERRSGRMIFLPDKVSSLEHYLQCLERASKVEESEDYNWQSVVALPEGSNKFDKYNSGLEPGFCDCVVVPAPPVSSKSIALKTIFPKVAALGGFRKDKKIKKGWIRYTNQVLMVVVGSGSPPLGRNPPKGCAVEGRGCHVPGNDSEVLFRVEKMIRSVQELFCEVEGQLNNL